MMTSQKICFIIITLGSRQEQEIMWAEDVLKKWQIFFLKTAADYLFNRKIKHFLRFILLVNYIL